MSVMTQREAEGGAARDSPPAGWIFYDDGCGICRKLMRLASPIWTPRGYRFLPLQADEAARLLGIASLEERLRDMRFKLADGSVFSGSRAYREMFRRVWWLKPLGLLMALPGLRWLCEKAYRRFADSRGCMIKPRSG